MCEFNVCAGPVAYDIVGAFSHPDGLAVVVAGTNQHGERLAAYNDRRMR